MTPPEIMPPKTVIEPAVQGSYVRQFEQLVQQLSQLKTEVTGIRSIMEASHQASENARNTVLEAMRKQQEKAAEVFSHISEEEQPDTYPFAALPEGSVIKELPDGNRIFILPEGTMIRTEPDQSCTIASGGTIRKADVEPGNVITVNPGLTLSVFPGWSDVLSEHDGISGLPESAEVTSLPDGKVSFECDGSKFIVDRKQKTVAIIVSSGIILIIAPDRILCVGEDISLQTLSSGIRSFTLPRNSLAGTVEPDGLIRLNTSGGRELVFSFSNDSQLSDEPEISPESLICGGCS